VIRSRVFWLTKTYPHQITQTTQIKEPATTGFREVNELKSEQ
jgi:hypothetical protein